MIRSGELLARLHENLFGQQTWGFTNYIVNPYISHVNSSKVVLISVLPHLFDESCLNRLAILHYARSFLTASISNESVNELC